LEIVGYFTDNLKEDEIELDVKDIVIIGSNANYNYTAQSDIDTHIIADMTPYKDVTDLALKLYNAYRSI
jgi:predicted nucleotidyltransferase